MDHNVTVEGRTVSLCNVARALTPEQLAYILEEKVNGFPGSQARLGKTVGRGLLECSHLHTQALEVTFLLGVIAGMAEQEIIDGRNKAAIHTCQQVTNLFPFEAW